MTQIPSVYITRPPIRAANGNDMPLPFYLKEKLAAVAPHMSEAGVAHSGDMLVSEPFNLHHWQAILTCVEAGCSARCVATAMLSDMS